MARRRPVEPTAAEGRLLLPRQLVDRSGLSADELRTFHRGQAAWFKAHGIDPADWNEVSAILKASRVAHGFPDTTAVTRARLRAAFETS